MWRGICLNAPLQSLKADAMYKECSKDKKPSRAMQKGITQYFVSITATVVPEFSIATWGHAANPPFDGGLWLNTGCWPDHKAPNDPGFALLKVDPWYRGRLVRYDYAQPYNPGAGNGV
jgi:hypothetical protein